MANADSIAVLVISCDAYRDLWRPFFELFWRHWPDCPYPVHLGSELHTHSDARVRRLDVGAQPDWSAACARMLARIEAPTTLVMLEDYLLYDRVDTASVEGLAAYLRTHDAACVRLFPCPGPDAPCADHPQVGVLRPGAPFRLSLQAALWNTRVLRGLLSPGEDPWQFETNGSARTADVPQPFFSVQRAHRPMRYFCTGVRRGLWLRDAVSLCRAQGVHVDLRARRREPLAAYVRRAVRFRLEGCRIAACRAQDPDGCVRHPCAAAAAPGS
ncbi:MAG: hypothetical protein ACRERC_02575 [Candidatus Binatia bacterium]